MKEKEKRKLKEVIILLACGVTICLMATGLIIPIIQGRRTTFWHITPLVASFVTIVLWSIMEITEKEALGSTAAKPFFGFGNPLWMIVAIASLSFYMALITATIIDILAVAPAARQLKTLLPIGIAWFIAISLLLVALALRRPRQPSG